MPDTKSSSLRKKKFSDGKAAEKAEGAADGEQKKKKPSFSRYPGPKVFKKSMEYRTTLCRVIMVQFSLWTLF